MSLYSSSLWRTDTIVISKLNKPPICVSPLLNGLEINKPPQGRGGGGLNKGFTVNIFLTLCCEKHSFPFMFEYPGRVLLQLYQLNPPPPPQATPTQSFSISLFTCLPGTQASIIIILTDGRVDDMRRATSEVSLLRVKVLKILIP